MQQRITLRVPQELAQAMELRARGSGANINAEYLEAIREHLQGDGEVVTVTCAGDVLQPWLTRDDIAAAQMSPAMIAMRAEPPGGFVLRGRVVSLDPQWFVSEEAFGAVRETIENSAAPLIAETHAEWLGTHGIQPIVTYGWPGPPPRLTTARELRVGRDAVLDYQIRIDIGDQESQMRASVSPEAWFRILSLLDPQAAPSWPDTSMLRGTDLLAARAFRDVVVAAADAGAEEVLVRASDRELIDRICRRAEELRGSGAGN